MSIIEAISKKLAVGTLTLGTVFGASTLDTKANDLRDFLNGVQQGLDAVQGGRDRYYDDENVGTPNVKCWNIPKHSKHGGTDRVCDDGYDSRNNGGGYHRERPRRQEWQTCVSGNTMYRCPRP